MSGMPEVDTNFASERPASLWRSFTWVAMEFPSVAIFCPVRQKLLGNEVELAYCGQKCCKVLFCRPWGEPRWALLVVEVRR